MLTHAPVPAEHYPVDGGDALDPARPVGMDVAILGNGYVYHTPTDDLAHAPRRQVRRIGVGTTRMLVASVDALAARFLQASHAAAHREHEDAAGGAAAAAAAGGSAPLLPNWSATEDAHGRTYFHNALTREVVWEAPLLNPRAG